MSTTSITKPKAKKSVASAKPVTASTENKKIAISLNERYQLIATAAYLKAESRGFQGEDSLGDWLAAEAEIDGRYSVIP